jgi:hypothetical protein
MTSVTGGGAAGASSWAATAASAAHTVPGAPTVQAGLPESATELERLLDTPAAPLAALLEASGEAALRDLQGLLAVADAPGPTAGTAAMPATAAARAEWADQHLAAARRAQGELLAQWLDGRPLANADPDQLAWDAGLWDMHRGRAAVAQAYGELQRAGGTDAAALAALTTAVHGVETTALQAAQEQALQRLQALQDKAPPPDYPYEQAQHARQCWQELHLIALCRTLLGCYDPAGIRPFPGEVEDLLDHALTREHFLLQQVHVDGLESALVPLRGSPMAAQAGAALDDAERVLDCARWIADRLEDARHAATAAALQAGPADASEEANAADTLLAQADQALREHAEDTEPGSLPALVRQATAAATENSLGFVNLLFRLQVGPDPARRAEHPCTLLAQTVGGYAPFNAMPASQVAYLDAAAARILAP